MELCRDPLVNASLSWNTTNPNLTDCMQDTVLTLIPTTFLVILAPIYLWFYRQKHQTACGPPPIILTENRPFRLYLLKMIFTSLLCGLAVVDLWSRLLIHGQSMSISDWFAPSCRLITFLTVFVVTVIERRRKIHTSATLFLFWLLISICYAPTFKSHLEMILRRGPRYMDPVLVTLTVLYWQCMVIQLILNCFSDIPREVAEHPERPPEYSSSYLSSIFFSWMNDLMKKGYKNPLAFDDLPQSPHFVDVRANTDRFLEKWNERIHKLNISFSSFSRLQSRTMKHISIWPVLISTFWPRLFTMFVLAFVHYSLTFVNPWVLRKLIDYIHDENQETWKGFFYIGVLFSSNMLWTVTFHQYCQSMTTAGLQMRNSLMSTIYRKSLRLSNNARRKFTVGEITNYMSVDGQRIIETFPYLGQLWTAPYIIIMAMVLLYQDIGASAFAGMGVLLLLLPVNIWGSKVGEKLQEKQLEKKDARIKLMNEILSGIKVLKLYAWEIPFVKRIMDIRNAEIDVLKSVGKLWALNNFTFCCTPFLVTLTVFSIYVNVDPSNVLSAQKIFVALALFNIMRLPLVMFPWALVESIKMFVSIRRINKFLNAEEIPEDNIHLEVNNSENAIELDQAILAWTADQPEPTLKDISLTVPKGKMIAIVGVVGSGKSSLLSAILGEMDVLSGEIRRIPGFIGYVPQQAWIQNMSLKNNILFDQPYSQARYNKVLDACALRSDLQILASGDETEIGENGINLSGGQKQRISLARAVYSNADLYLFDDPLSAVDAHVGKHLFENVFSSKTGMLKGKTRILVTHSISYLPEVDYILVVRDGIIAERGTYQELLDGKGAFSEFLSQHGKTQSPAKDTKHIRHRTTKKRTRSKSECHPSMNQLSEAMPSPISYDERSLSGVYFGSPRSLGRAGLAFDEAMATIRDAVKRNQTLSMASNNYERLEDVQESNEESTSDLPLLLEDSNVPTSVEDRSRLIQEETAMVGNVKLSVYLHYFKSIGWLVFAICILMYAGSQSLQACGNFALAYWADYNDRNSSHQSKTQNHTQKYLVAYASFGVGEMIIIVVRELILFLSCAKASKLIHDELLTRVLHSPMSFFDTNPIGRVVNRFSADVDIVDQTIPFCLSDFIACVVEVLGVVIVICYSTPMFLSVILPLFVMYFLVQRYYIASSRQMKRLESISKSPLFSHFTETVQGVSSVRAYKQEDRFITESEARLGKNVQCYYHSLSSNRWLAMRNETIGNLVILFAALFAVLSRDRITASLAGLSITYALNITDILNWIIRMLCQLETNAVSLERILEYSKNKQEAEWVKEDCALPSSWPDRGEITFKDYSTRYREGMDLVLKGINLEINSMEKVGICGRTGAGKSSLTLALFRLIEPAGGRILVDHVDIASLGLHQLRSRLSIIPQDPVLFTGSLRFNLDPTETKTDADIWAALDHAHLRSHITSLEKGLDHEVSEGGGNFSVGQRQLICLARALLRKSKILILDEATAAVDLETDSLIQTTIRAEFADCTIITIAHRLMTIMDSNKIVVLKEGTVQEIGKPDELMKVSDSAFKALASHAGIL